MLISILEGVLDIGSLVLVFATTALALQAAAALLGTDRSASLSPARPSIAVLVPAHDEERNIGDTVGRIAQELSPGDRLVVIADNCCDRTAELAADGGAEVLVRAEPGTRGKGFALAAGLRLLSAAPPQIVIIIDADCRINHGGLGLLARACAAANAPTQCLNLMTADPASRAPPRLAEFAWRIKNSLRPCGYARLGLPCQLLGTGMALPWSLIRADMFATGHLAEDLLLGLELALQGSPPRFFRDACVTSYFPDAQPSQDRQRQRWVQGHFALIASHVLRLIDHALRRRDLKLLALAADISVPPLGVLAAGYIAALLTSVTWLAVFHAAAPLVISGLGAALLLSSLLAAWHLCGRDLVGRAELEHVPRHLAVALGSALNAVRGRKVSWTRTDRTPALTPNQNWAADFGKEHARTDG